MSVTEALEIMEANVNGLSARNIETFQSFTDKTNEIQEDIGALSSHLQSIQELRSCLNGICQLGDWKPARQ